VVRDAPDVAAAPPENPPAVIPAPPADGVPSPPDPGAPIVSSTVPNHVSPDARSDAGHGNNEASSSANLPPLSAPAPVPAPAAAVAPPAAAPVGAAVALAAPRAAHLKSVPNLFLPSKYKVVFLGDMSVGKTSIIARFMYNTFDKQEHTIGIDFLSKTMQIDDRSIRLQLWDTAGQERYRSLISGYIRESQAAVVVYDTTSRPSFDSTEKWVDDVRRHCGPEVVIVLAGNKSDLTSKRTVTKDEGEAKALSTKCLFVETSAKTGAGVQSLFTKMASALSAEAAASPLAAPGPAPPPAMYRDSGSGPFSLTAVSSTGRPASSSWCGC